MWTVRGTRTGTILAAVATTVTALLCGCSTDGPQSHDAAESQPVAASAAGKSGVQLWAENCSRCHYARPPQSFSETQWEVIVHHMRLRADLTGQEARTIAAFLKAG